MIEIVELVLCSLYEDFLFLLRLPRTHHSLAEKHVIRLGLEVECL